MHENFANLARRLIPKNGRKFILVLGSREKEIVGTELSFSIEERKLNGIEITDKKILVGPDIYVDNRMRLKEVNGSASYDIVNVWPLIPGETIIRYVIQARK